MDLASVFLFRHHRRDYCQYRHAGVHDREKQIRSKMASCEAFAGCFLRSSDEIRHVLTCGHLFRDVVLGSQELESAMIK